MGPASVGLARRWESTTWMASPAVIYSLILAHAGFEILLGRSWMYSCGLDRCLRCRSLHGWQGLAAACLPGSSILRAASCVDLLDISVEADVAHDLDLVGDMVEDQHAYRRT